MDDHLDKIEIIRLRSFSGIAERIEIRARFYAYLSCVCTR